MSDEAFPFNESLLAILRCPQSGAKLRYDRERGELVSREAGLAYPIRDGIAVMLVEEARRLDGADEGEARRQSSSR